MAANNGQYIDLDVEDLQPSEGAGSKFLLWLLSVVLFLAIIVVGTVLIAQAVKFEPLTIYAYEVDKSEYCPLEEIKIEQELSIQDKWYYTVDSLEGSTYLETADGRPYTDSDFNVPIEGEVPRDVYPSNTVRIAPPIPGQWAAVGEGVLHGRMFGVVPVTQEIDHQSSSIFKVKNWDEPECLASILPNLVYEQSGE